MKHAFLLTWLFANLVHATTATVVIDNPAVTMKVTPRTGNTSTSMLCTINKNWRVVVNGVVAYPQGGSITLSWTPSKNVSSYIVRYTPTSMHPDGTCTDCKELKVAGATTSSTTVDGLDPTTPWMFTVIGVGPKGNHTEVSPTIVKSVEQ